MALQIRRGTNKERLGITPVEGEIVYVTDSQLSTVTVTTIDGSTELMTTAVPHELVAGQKVKFISNTANGLTENAIYYVLASGLTTGVFKVSTTSGGSAVNLTSGSGLTLQFATTPTDANNEPIGHSVAPVWVGDGVTTGGLAAGASTLDELSDVSIGVSGLDGVALDNNQMLQYNSTRNQWENRSNITVPGTLDSYGTFTSHGNTVLGDQTSDSVTFGTPIIYTPVNLNIDGGTLYVDATNNYVGIGDTTPSYKLDVAGSIRSTSNIIANGSLTVNGSATIDGNATIGSDSADTVTINAVAVAAPNGLNIDSDTLIVDATNDRVGVGIDPTVKFDVNGSARFRGTGVTVDGDLAVNGGDITTTATTFNIANSNATTVTAFGAATNLTIGASGGEAGGTTTVRNNVVVSGDFQVGNSAQFTVDAATGDTRIYSTTASSGQNSGALQVDGGVGINGTMFVGGDVEIDSTTGSVSVDSGALRVDGGVGINENIYVGGLANIAGAFSAASGNISGGLYVGGDLTVAGTTTTINSTVLTVDDKNIELGSVNTPTDTTADGGGITLKGTTDKTITWSASSSRWESNIGFNSTGSKIGNVDIANGANDNTITTTTGNLILDAASNTIQVDANITQTGTLTNDGVTANDISIGVVASNRISSSSGDLVLEAPGDQVVVDGSFAAYGDVELGVDNLSEILFTGLVNSNIDFKQPTSGPRGVTGTAGGNDMWFFGGGQTGTDAGYAVIATADNGTEPIYVRQFPTQADMLAGTNATRSLTLLDASGNTSLPGNLTVGSDGYIYSSTDLALDLTGADVRVAGDLTVSGNDIKSSSATVFTLSGSDATVAGDLTVTSDLDVNGTFLDGVTLERSFLFAWDEANTRTYRPTFQSSTGNVSGVRVLAPNATSSASAQISVFSTNDSDNGTYLNFQARGGATNPLRIQSGEYSSGVSANTTKSIAFTNNDGTAYATVNPSGVTETTDLTTKSYVDSEVDKLQDGTTAFTVVNLNAIAGIKTYELVTSATTADQTLASWSATTYRSAKYQIQIESGTEFQSMEALVVHNGTTAYITIYADIKTGSTDLATVGVTLTGGNVVLQVTPANAITTFRAVETAVKKA